ncbi:MAG: caspase family protein [Clostridia bacterium]|nr:caspase family protein [Clostridia bacterium]
MCLLLSAWIGAGVCVSENSEIPLPLNQRLFAEAGETIVKIETSVSGSYILHAFSEKTVHAEAVLDGEILASGTLPLTVSIPENIEIAIRLFSNAPFTFEVMRASHGRNALSAIEITPSMNRTITRARDVHFLSYTAKTDQTVLFRSKPAIKKGVRTHLLPLSPSGETLGKTYINQDSASSLVHLKAGETCILRVWAEGDETGAYVLACEAVTSDKARLTDNKTPAPIRLVTGEWTRVDIASSDFILTSDAEHVFTVTADGVITGTGEGEGMLSIRDLFGNTCLVPVSVERASVTGVEFQSTEITLHVGEFIYPAYTILPPYASDHSVSFACADESVVTVSQNASLIGVNPGTTTVTITTGEGGFTDTVIVTVKEPESVYRALTVGIATYENERERTGCINTTQGMADALSRSGEGYLTDMRLDLTKKELFDAIHETFSGATENDVSLFYINCHGGMTAGTAWLEMRYGSKVTAMELESALRKIPGTVIVIIDCCQSGAFLEGSFGESAFATKMISQFTGESAGKSAFASRKYKLLVSSSASQNSYRMASSSPATEQNMSTVFARSLTEGLGWNLIKDKKASMKADIDNNRQISLHEAWLYTMKRTMSYLNKSTARQTVDVWPRGDTFVIMR